MIKKTTTFSLGILFSLMLFTSSVYSKGVFSRNAVPAEKIVHELDSGLQSILDQSATVEEAVQKINKLNPEIGTFLDKLLKYLNQELSQNPDIVNNEEESEAKIQQFVMKYFSAIQIIKYRPLLTKIGDVFKKYTKEQFEYVVRAVRPSGKLNNAQVGALAVTGI